MIGVVVPPTIPSPSLLTGKPKVHHKQLQISKNPYVWNTRIRTSIENNRHQQALILYLSMVKEFVPPDEFTFPLVIKACSVLMDIKVGKQIHTQVLKNGFLVGQDVFVQNSLLYMYANCGFLEIARRVFDGMAERTLVSWNSMMNGYSKYVGFGFEAIVVYVLMLKGGIMPDCYSFTALVRACSSALAVQEAAQIHSHVIKLGFEYVVLVRTGLIDMYVKFGYVNAALVLFNRSTERDVVSWNALITGFIRMGELGSAEALFNKMDVRNVVSWNTMISGYVQNGLCSEALDYFRRMQLEGVNPNSVTVVSVLSACSVAGSLSLGKWVHLYSESQGLIGANEIVKAALVNMYAKCGDLESAHGIFETMVEKDVVSWDVMIEGFALHGRGGDALELFHQMIREGVKPDEITFIGLLNACRHTGLVNEGLKFFRSMSIEFGIEPNLEHFACIVDLLGREGRLTEALEVIKAMPMAPDVVVWSALLGACRTQNDLLLAESVVEHIVRLDPACSSSYVALSNIYAARNQWADVARVRKIMKTKEAKKEPGCSLIEIGGAVTEFIAGDSSHHQCREIFQKLDELMMQIKINGYVPNTNSVLHNMEQEEKAKSLYFHSEKLAVAFGIINTSPGTVIRIVKNLRICMDCHSAIKLIAQIEGREIIIRDQNRFHHFKDGQCSCGNYW